MELNKDAVFIVDESNKKTPSTLNVDILPEISDFDKDFETPKNLIGYYVNLFKNFFNEKNMETVQVNVSYQEEFIPNNTTPLILISRGTITPSLSATPGDTFQLTPVGEINVNGVNPNETKSGIFLLEQDMEIKIYSSNRAELEKISYMIYLLLLSCTDDVLSMVFDKIVRVSEPVMSQIIPYPKQSDYYFTQIQWKISYKECNILLFKEKLIKYNRLIMRENESKRIL